VPDPPTKAGYNPNRRVEEVEGLEIWEQER
jgi:hypothetical protein